LAKVELSDPDSAPTNVGGGLKTDSDVAGAFGADLDNDRLDEDLDARDVEFFDNPAQRLVVLW
jgi:hypothetical protein